MANDKVVGEFDSLLAELLATAPDAVITEEADVGDEPTVVATPILKMETVGEVARPASVQQAEVVLTGKLVYRHDEGKKPVVGAPFDAIVYSRGYVQAKWDDGWRFANKCCWYLEELEALEKFFGSPGYAKWKQNCINAGLRQRYRRG